MSVRRVMLPQLFAHKSFGTWAGPGRAHASPEECTIDTWRLPRFAINRKAGNYSSGNEPHDVVAGVPLDWTCESYTRDSMYHQYQE